MKYITLFLLIITVFSCTPKECQIDSVDYNFILPANLSPTKDTFNIGDTITVRSQFSNMVYDRETEQHYILNDIQFFLESRIRRIDTIGKIDDFTEFEVIVNSEYDFSFFNYSTSGARALIGDYNYDNEYDLEFKLVPQKRGLFFFILGSSINSFGEDQHFDGKCKNIEIGASVEMNAGADNNVDFLLDSPDEEYNTLIWNRREDQFHRFGGYCFYVK